MKTCDIRLNTISDMQKRGAIDTALTIVDRPLFNQLNDKYSDLARTKYNVTNQGSLFTEQVKEVPRLGNTPYNRENTKSVNKAVLNQKMFTELQTNYNLRQQGDLIFYQVTEPKQTHQTVPPDGNFMTLLTNFFNKNGFKLSMDVLKDYREFFDFKSGIDLIQKEVFLPDENFVPTKEAAVLGVTLLKKTEEFFKLSNHIKAWDQYADKKRFYIQEIKNKGKVFGNDAVEIAEMYVMYDFVENYIVPNYDKLLQADKTYRKESEVVKKLKEVSFIEKAFKYFNKMLKKLFVLKPSFQEAEGAAKKIAAEKESIDKLREELVKKYGVEENGSVSIPLYINEVIDDETKEVVSREVNPNFVSFQNDFNLLLQEERELEYHPFKLEEFENVETEGVYVTFFKLIEVGE